MNLAMIHSLFTLFSNEEDSHAFAPLINASVIEVQRQLRDGADVSDVRLCYLVASIAYLRYTQINGAKDYPLATFAGNISRVADGSQKLSFAERLVKDYQRLCGDLLKNQDSIFFAVGGDSCEYNS
ncbi:MAG: hypothetical protein V3G42_01120 [Oscillospiraceae bacterium]